jgi:hypothetical protein
MQPIFMRPCCRIPHGHLARRATAFGMALKKVLGDKDLGRKLAATIIRRKSDCLNNFLGVVQKAGQRGKYQPAAPARDQQESLAGAAGF